MAHNMISNTATHIRLHTPTQADTPTVAILVSSLLPNRSTQLFLVMLAASWNNNGTS